VVGSVASLQIYKTLLTAVGGINLSVGPEKNESAAKAPFTVVVKANFTRADDDTPLKSLPLYFRLANDTGRGEIKKTEISGRAKYSFPVSVAGGSTVRGFEVRLLMSPYVVDRDGLSPQLAQKIGFLEAMLESKVATYGAATFAEHVIPNSPFQAAVLTTTEGGLVEMNVASDNAYMLLGSSAKQALMVKVDIMPMQTTGMRRRPLNLSVVLDRSSSMHEDGKIDFTKKATEFLIDNLTPRDYLSIVAYDSDVEVIVAAGPVSFHDLLKHHLSEIEPDGMTNLSGGLFEGYAQVKQNINTNGVNRILLLSDGKANRGISESEELIPYIRRYGEEGIAVSALGVGQDFNEELMMALAEASNGNYYYIKNPEYIPEIFSPELTRLVNVAAQNALVNIKLEPGVRLVDSFGHPFSRISQHEYRFRMGDINYGGRGILLIELDAASQGEAKKNLATVEVSYDNTGGEGRVSSTKKISVVYTHDADRVASSKNVEVDKYVLLTRSIEQLEDVLQTLDRGLYQEAIQSLRVTYASLESFARASEDPEFLQRMKFLKHFEHEIAELQASDALHGHDAGVTKKLGYQIYLEKHSHRLLDHPLHPSAN
jgi:Ca-activated chloride channel family protein